MPGSDAARRYGNRGGGWLPPPAAPSSPAVVRAYIRPAERSTHPDDIAAARGMPDRKADTEALWAGRARMAAARRDAGRPLDDIDRQALRRLDTT